jgi:hypothetical protein
MPGIVVHRPTSLPQYMELIQSLQKRAGHSLWFRGNGRNQFKLVPTLYRHTSKKSEGEHRKLEVELMARFRQRSIPYLTRELRDDWDALFFMQHYGVPTRLLDWTENPLVGLYFALMSSRSTRSESSAIVWVLNPFVWNRAALNHVSYNDGPLTAGDQNLKGYVPALPADTAMGEFPVALYGAHNSPRIVAQRGVFTIFGANRKPMETLVKGGDFPSAALSCILVNHRRVTSMRDSLLSQGTTETVVFPDLDGLARETKRFFGFEP